MPPTVAIIVAHDDKLGIGSSVKNDLLWHISKDFQHFKTLTTNHPIIMGRKTFQSLPKALPDRTNIVVTRDETFSAPGCLTAASLEEAIELAKTIDPEKIFIIGGGEIYRQAMERGLVDKLYLTHVKGDFKADVFFPDYSHFKLLKREADNEGDYQFEFLELVKPS